jgi:20S proteasome alpha/beta subunit
VRSFCQQHRFSYGEPPTVERAARHAADLQHELTRTGGARPLGCTAVLVGLDPEPGGGTLRLYQTDPGGILEECVGTVGGKDQRSLMNSLKARASEIWADEDGDASREGNPDAPSSAMRSVSTIFQAFCEGTTADSEPTSSVDVWLIRPSPGRRGGIRTVCFSGVPRADPRSLADAVAKSGIFGTGRSVEDR